MSHVLAVRAFVFLEKAVRFHEQTPTRIPLIQRAGLRCRVSSVM